MEEKRNREEVLLVNKIRIRIVSAVLMCCFLMLWISSVEAKNIENDTYQICKNDIFIDYDQLNCKKIVTEVKDDGRFIAVDLGDWLKKQNIYDISVIEDNKSEGYKRMFYERNQEREEADEFYNSEDTSYIHFEGLVYEGDVISYTDSLIETVTEVRFDGSFYTQVEPQPSFFSSETEEASEGRN